MFTATLTGRGTVCSSPREWLNLTGSLSRTMYKVRGISRGVSSLGAPSLLKRPGAVGPVSVTFTTAHLRNTDAKKKQTSIKFLRRFRTHLDNIDCDIVGADLNMAACDTDIRSVF